MNDSDGEDDDDDENDDDDDNDDDEDKKIFYDIKIDKPTMHDVINSDGLGQFCSDYACVNDESKA